MGRALCDVDVIVAALDQGLLGLSQPVTGLDTASISCELGLAVKGCHLLWLFKGLLFRSAGHADHTQSSKPVFRDTQILPG